MLYYISNCICYKDETTFIKTLDISKSFWRQHAYVCLSTSYAKIGRVMDEADPKIRSVRISHVLKKC